MGNNASVQKVNFEDMQMLIRKEKCYVINTLDVTKQQSLIYGTLCANEEELVLNEIIRHGDDVTIVVYGKNSCDTSIISKHEQLVKIGFTKVFVYPGGMFEWMLLQDIYGSDLFPTTMIETDIMKFVASSIFNN